jgi:spore coat protein H
MIFSEQCYKRVGWGCLRWGARFLGCLLVSTLVGCGNDVSNNDTEKSDTGNETDVETSSDPDAGLTGCGPVDTELPEGDAAELFDLPAVPVFNFYLPPAVWEQLQIDARDEQYVEAEACFEGRSIGKVGLRFKGSYGTLYNCFVDDVNTCSKLSLKTRFDEYDTDRRFYGLKHLNFQGYRFDGSYMKEKLAYELYRSMDITAPRASWAEVRVNDELQGLFGMVEQIDGRFTADRWSDSGDGNLYKELWPINTDPSFVVSRLKTNEEVPNVDAFIAFSEAMLAADEADLRSTLGDFMNLDYLDRYMATVSPPTMPPRTRAGQATTTSTSMRRRRTSSH